MQSVYDSQDAVPEALREEYTEQDGRWVLKLDGDHPAVTAVVAEANRKVGEFRNNNVGLNQKLEATSAELEVWKGLGLSPEEIKGQADRLKDMEQKGVKKGDDIQTQIQAALKPVTEALEAERNARTVAEQTSARQAIESTLTKAGVAAGVAETALGDFLARGSALFQNQNGQLVAIKDGAPIYSPKRPGEVLTVEEWASDLQAEAPHLYKPNVGGGAAQPGKGSPAGGPRRIIAAEDISNNLEDVASGRATIQLD